MELAPKQHYSGGS